MGGKSSSQVVGYRYFASLAKFIGFRIEGLIGINFDNRKWIFYDGVGNAGNLIEVSAPELYGEAEGGVSGEIDVHVGEPSQGPNAHYQLHDPLISGFPYKSYLIFRGKEGSKHSFYHGNTNTMRDVLLWPKRTRIQNDGNPQWYEIDYSNPEKEIVVCEIDASTKYIPPADQTNAEFDVFYNRYSMFRGEVQPNFSTTVHKNIQLNNGGGVFYAAYSPGVGTDGSGQKQTYLRHNIRVSDPRILFDYKVTVKGYSESLSVSVGGARLVKEEIYGVVVDRHYEGKFSSSLNISGSTSGIGENGDTSLYIEVEVYNPRLAPPSQSLRYKGYDINPIHKIHEILTNPHPWGMGKPETDFNDENFRKAALSVWHESLGISWAIKDKDCLEAIEELCHHIEAGCRVNRQTGKYEMVLFRDDWFNEDEIHKVSQSKIKTMQLDVQNVDEIVNHVNVSFYDREQGKQGAFSISENGLIKTVGNIVSEDIEFPYFMEQRNAEIVANWKLKQFSTAAWKGTFTTGWREARKWNRYDLIRLPWSRKWQGTILVRIMKIGLGTSTNDEVTIDFVEVVPHSRMMNTTIVADQPTNVGALQPLPSDARVFELPYYLAVYSQGQRQVDEELAYDSDVGYVATIAAPVQSNSLNAAVYSNNAIPEGEFERVATVNYCEALVLDQAIGKTENIFVVKDTSHISTGQARRFTGADAETLILLNNELMSFISYNETTKVLTVKRGVLDVPVQSHTNGSKLYIFDLTDLAINGTKFVDGELVSSKVLTTTPSGVQSLDDTAEHLLLINARAIRPYPPANVKFNGSYWPETHVASNDLEVTWSHRNRQQQTGGTHVDWYANSVTAESGVTYSLELSTVDGVLLIETGINADNFTIPSDKFEPNKAHKLTLWAVRDGYESLYKVEHNFFVESVSLILTANVTSNSAYGNTLPEAGILVEVDTSLTAKMRFDGTNITGKAEPGSVITIEVDD